MLFEEVSMCGIEILGEVHRKVACKSWLKYKPIIGIHNGIEAPLDFYIHIISVSDM